MLILTTEEINFSEWQFWHSDVETLFDCLAVFAGLEDE